MSKKKENNKEHLARLEQEIDEIWERMLASAWAKEFVGSVMTSDRRTIALYLIQVYYYTSHVPRNQALVGVNPNNTNPRYMKYCFEHALEETGHELMALHDLRALGVHFDDPAQDFPRPFVATEMLNAWLYWVSTQGNVVQRLGFTYWAERCYHVVGSIVEEMKESMKLSKSSMTFFYSHANIDVKHAKEVEDILLEVCEGPEDWEAVARTARATLKLTEEMLQQVVLEYQKLAGGQDSEYEFLNQIAA